MVNEDINPYFCGYQPINSFLSHILMKENPTISNRKKLGGELWKTIVL